jgi:hypothetical protein
MALGGGLAYARAAQADGVLRIHPATVPLEDADGRRFDVLAWLRRPGPATREWVGWGRWQGQRSPVRRIASPLPPEQAARARARKQRKARKRGRRPAASTPLRAGWLLVVTTLPAQDWPADAVVRRYRARWQVELVFKRFKQLLRVRPLRCQRRDVAEATARAMLIAWVLQEDLATAVRTALREDRQGPVSSWRVCQLSLDTLRQAVLGRWTRARRWACLPRLRRFLCSSPRRRVHQETHIREWVQHRTQATWLATAG